MKSRIVIRQAWIPKQMIKIKEAVSTRLPNWSWRLSRNASSDSAAEIPRSCSPRNYYNACNPKFHASECLLLFIDFAATCWHRISETHTRLDLVWLIKLESWSMSSLQFEEARWWVVHLQLDHLKFIAPRSGLNWDSSAFMWALRLAPSWRIRKNQVL